jgi:hypothetical protein
MFEQFEVRWEGVLPGAPQQAFDAITGRAAGWLWEVAYEPRQGGAERGLTSSGGVVTAWEPPRRFQARALRPDGWHNMIDYTLEPVAGGTLLRYVHVGVSSEDHAAEHDACVRHTDFYYHSLGAYLGHFAGRDAAYAAVDAAGSFAEVCARIGVPGDAGVGAGVRLAPDGPAPVAAIVDYRAPTFLGLRTEDALVRVFGREPWGGGVTVCLHLFAPGVDADAVRRAWGAWLGAGVAAATGAVA